MLNRSISVHLGRFGRHNIFGQLLVHDRVLGGEQSLAVAFATFPHHDGEDPADGQHDYHDAHGDAQDW